MKRCVKENINEKEKVDLKGEKNGRENLLAKDEERTKERSVTRAVKLNGFQNRPN